MSLYIIVRVYTKTKAAKQNKPSRNKSYKQYQAKRVNTKWNTKDLIESFI